MQAPPPPLPAQSPLPPGLQAELLADVERIRAHHPHQRIVECSDQLEAWGLKGACGLDRVELVHKVIFKLQQRYNTIPMQTYEYSSRRAHVQHFRRALHLPGIRTVCEIGFNAGMSRSRISPMSNVAKRLPSDSLPGAHPVPPIGRSRRQHLARGQRCHDAALI